jgi:hypothetical protein
MADKFTEQYAYEESFVGCAPHSQCEIICQGVLVYEVNLGHYAREMEA